MKCRDGFEHCRGIFSGSKSDFAITFALDTTGQVIIRRDRLPREPGVYAFVDCGVAYIGHTAAGTLDGRVRSYLRKKYHAHRTVGPALLKALEKRRRVRIMTLPVRPRLWKELEITDTFGIEQALLKRLKPPWN
jgi:hypothetical protein